MYITKVRAAVLSYRYVYLFPFLLCIPGCWLYLQEDAIWSLLLSKGLLDALLLLLLMPARSAKLFYYYNLQLSKTTLFITWLAVGLVLFCILLWLTKIMY